ncbi:alcohol oxidase [Vararia minispora EC-137]|uniref:Alcohol oxidase n=1 Tax=Vararia minispora EC-137 TaxID=1314806 RepID=A0ACB8QE36_9AGAM|nr:alcohol oxidase [Vararia minispora EC-137]
MTSPPTPSFPPSSEELSAFSNTIFDVIVVGGGTAGLTLAARLTENPNVAVGVIEAGRSHHGDPVNDIPRAGMAHGTTGNPDYDWAFQTVRQENAGRRNILVTRGKAGKALGGSSAVNFMAWDRASQPEYDAWVPFSSLDWSFNKLLPYFNRSETVSSAPNLLTATAEDITDPKFAGTDGPIQAGQYSHIFPISLTVAETSNKLCIETNAFPHAGKNTGLVSIPASVDNKTGKRSYAAQAYYYQQPHKANLKILTGAHLTKVLLEKTSADLLATGVEYSVSGKLYTARASKEVVLSAGAVQSPQILELSGTGNPTILEGYGIPVLNPLPSVGENLQEHCFSFAQWQLPTGTSTWGTLGLSTFRAFQQLMYVSRSDRTGTGLLASSDSIVAWIPARTLFTPARHASLLTLLDAEIAAASAGSLMRAQLEKQRELFEDDGVAAAEVIQWSMGLMGQPGESYISILGGIMHPTSRASVHIASRDPLAHPDLDLGFLSTKFDQEQTVEVMKYVFALGSAEPFKSSIVARTLPPVDLPTDADILAMFTVAARRQNGGHVLGTAAMAPRSLGGVVDASLRVYGTRNLRVVDASIMPLQLSAHIQATVYALAEKVRHRPSSESLCWGRLLTNRLGRRRQM